jgi:hypothetical protein
MPPRFWRWAAICIGAGMILWWKLEEGKTDKLRNELLSRQRAVSEQLGPRWFPLREKIESWTSECAAPDFKPVRADRLVEEWDFRPMPGIYLRLGQKDAGVAKSIREAATKSLHDGFTSCLLMVNNPNPIAGTTCLTTQDCAKGQLCNDYKRCAAYAQPYNLRLAYRTLYVLTDEWIADIQDISSRLILRGAAATFEAANKYEFPVAAELLQRAKYFMVVVDEEKALDDTTSTDSLPEVADAGHADDRAIPTAPHLARVCVWRLADDEKMVALRGRASGTLMGGMEPQDMRTRISRQRQANSCALALEVREAIGGAQAAGVPEREKPVEGDAPSQGDDAAGGGAPAPKGANGGAKASDAGSGG